MRLTHIYDHDYYVNGDDVYSSGAFHADSWNRYLNHFDSLLVVANEKKGGDPKAGKLNRVNSDKVNFRFLPKQSSPGQLVKGLTGRNAELEEIVKNSDALAIRLFSELGYQAVGFARKHGVPYALEIVGCPWDAYWNHQNKSGKVMAVLSYYRMRKSVKNAPFVIYVTAEFLQRRYPTNGVSHNASNVMLAEVGEEVLKDRLNRMGRDTDKPLQLAMIAGLEVKAKAHDVTIAALGRVKDMIPDFCLRLVGPGDPARVLSLAREAGIEDKVDVIGKLTSGMAIFDFLDNTDLYLHPSKQEGLPRAIIEAMSRACPVLASSTAGIPELVGADFLHKPGDDKRLSEQLMQVCGNKDLRMDMAKTNFSTAYEYSPSVLNEKRSKFWGAFRDYCESK